VKKVGTTETNYTLNGKPVVHLTKGSDWMHFYYDAQGRPAMVNFNGTKYHYLHNLQGDIIGIVDASGNIVVEYKYDAWGKIIGRTGSLVSTLGYLNPFRYRGYIYDEETGLYYLRSRYYNPEWCRFINADVCLGERGTLLSHNVFAYCCDAPIDNADKAGKSAAAAIWIGVCGMHLLTGLVTARIGAANKAAKQVDDAANKSVISKEQIMKAAFRPIPSDTLNEILHREQGIAGGWSKTLFSYTQGDNHYVSYSLSSRGSVIRTDYCYSGYSLDRDALPLYSFLDFLVELTADPMFSFPFLSEEENGALGVMLYAWENIRDIELDPMLEVISTKTIYESEGDRKIRKAWEGLY